MVYKFHGGDSLPPAIAALTAAVAVHAATLETPAKVLFCRDEPLTSAQGITSDPMKPLIFLPAVALAAGLALAAALPAQAHAPERHKFRLVTFNPPPAAMPFELAGPGGSTLRLADFRGKVLLLNFWATWCPPCVREMPSMEALYQKYKNRNFAVLAISLDEKGEAVVAPFVKKLKLTFAIALDVESRVSALYGARDLPSSFLIDPKGKVIAAAKGERDWFSPEAQSYMDELLTTYSGKMAGG